VSETTAMKNVQRFAAWERERVRKIEEMRILKNETKEEEWNF